MTTATELKALVEEYAEETFRNRQRCMSTMRNRSAEMAVTHCEPDWDPYSAMCWGPTPAGMTIKLRCPNDGFLNPNKYASRLCLSSATWYVNKTFDDRPYTNFDDCFVADAPTAEEMLKNLVGDRIFMILKYMDKYKDMFFALHIISIAFLIAALIVCAALVLKLGRKNPAALSYISLGVSAIALLVVQTVTLSVNSVGDAHGRTKCKVAKTLVSCSVIIFYEFLFLYLYLCNTRILNYVVRSLCIKVAVWAAVLLAVGLVLTGLLTETFLSPGVYCGFRNVQTAYHWFTTAPKFLLLMSVTCLDSVAIFGAFCLKQVHLEKKGELYHIRQMGISALVFILFSAVGETFLSLIHTEEYLKHSESPLELYVHAFSLVAAIQSILFSLLMCALDFGVLAQLGLPFKNRKSRIIARGEEDAQSSTFNEGSGKYQYELKLQNNEEAAELFTDSKYQIELQSQSAGPEPEVHGPQPHICQSKLIFGPLKTA